MLAAIAFAAQAIHERIRHLRGMRAYDGPPDIRVEPAMERQGDPCPEYRRGSGLPSVLQRAASRGWRGTRKPEYG